MATYSEQVIEAFALKIRELAKATGLPTPLEKIVKSMGGTIQECNDPFAAEAKVFKVAEAFTIELSSSMTNELRKRFSIAHELGHIVLHSSFLNHNEWKKLEDGVAFYRQGVGRAEYEANEFAAALLMPAVEFQKIAYQNLNGQSYDIESIANAFQVSIEAAKVRGQWLGLFSW